MKKQLALFGISILFLTAFVSCGDSNSSDDSLEMSESSISETITEETTEATTEKETETTTQKQIYELDSVFEFDIASLSIPSFCEIGYNEENDNYAYLHISWEDNSNYHELIFYFYKDPEAYKKSGRFDKNNIIDTFTINGNKCMVDNDAYIPTTIFYTNEVASGRIHYDDEDEELVKQIIDTIKFNTEEVETTNEKTTKSDIIANRKAKAHIGDISFKIPDGYEKEANSSDESAETVTYTYDDLEMINIAKQPGASQFEWDSIDDETKKSMFEVFIESALSNYFETVGDLEIITIDGAFAVKQNAVYSGTNLPLTAYAFVYGDNLYIFMFTNMIDTQNEIIDSINFESISATTKKEQTTKPTTQEVTKAPEPVTEPPTEKPTETQPPVIETTPVNVTLHFVLNTDSNCVHINPDCSAAQQILPENYSEVDIAESDLGNYANVYWACGKCSRGYQGILPKF